MCRSKPQELLFILTATAALSSSLVRTAASTAAISLIQAKVSAITDFSLSNLVVVKSDLPVLRTRCRHNQEGYLTAGAHGGPQPGRSDNSQQVNKENNLPMVLSPRNSGFVSKVF